MNYYRRHIGDYLKATSHLSLLEHGIYTRLLDVYYTREGPIPADQAARLVGARGKVEIDALNRVLEEFFDKAAEGWRQGRCDKEIAEYSDKSGKAAESARKRWEKEQRNADAMRTHSDGNAPTPNSHKPIANIKPEGEIRAGEACMEMRKAGVASVNPSHAELIALLQAGVEPLAFGDLAREILAEKSIAKPFPYILKVMRNRLETKPIVPSGNSWRSKDDQRAATIAGLTGATRQERDITADSHVVG